MDDTILNFNLPTNAEEKIIKAIGVGGGGGNAVSNMYMEGISDVSFALCNTDNQALRKSSVPNKLLIGTNTTGGLGAGDNPAKGEAAALESEAEIRSMLNDGTRMAFITAGMGGGTGTGAAPVIAKISKEMGILTVGIVTIPYLFEGRTKLVKAVKGVGRMAENVDSLVVINNQDLLGFENLSVPQANRKADETLTVSARSIAEIITTNLEQNVDFADVDTTMRGGGVALVSVGIGEGEGRLRKAIQQALDTTLANDKDKIYNARRVALVIYYSHENELMVNEMADVESFMDKFNTEYAIKWGHGYDDTLGDKIKITILATGFGLEDVLSEETVRYETEDDMLKAAERAAAEKEKREKENKMIERYYGTYGKSAGKSVILEQEELDNDPMIAVLEDNPAYNRDPRLVERVRSNASGRAMRLSAQPAAKQPEVELPRKEARKNTKGKNVISFK